MFYLPVPQILPVMFFYQDNEIPYQPEEIFNRVEASRGKVREGAPEWMPVLRILYAVFG